MRKALHHEKGITPIIAVVILLFIVIALGGSAYFILFGVYDNLADVEANPYTKALGCGDGICTAAEAYTFCTADCGQFSPSGGGPGQTACGANGVEQGEVCDPPGSPGPACTSTAGYTETGQCNADCTGYDCPSSLFCGDASCDPPETKSTCADCKDCGDGVCTLGEDSSICPQDCSTCNNDGVCAGTEDADSCYADCGDCGDGSVDGPEACEPGQTLACTVAGKNGNKYCLSTCAGYGACEYCGDSICNNNEKTLICGGDCKKPVVTFTTAIGDAQVTLSYTITDNSNPPDGPINVVILRSLDSTVLVGLTQASFDAPPAKTQLVSTDSISPGATGTTVDSPLDNDILYSYRLRACDSAPSPSCTLSGVIGAKPEGPHLTFAPGAEETVFDWSLETCGTSLDPPDLPDVNARVLRNAQNELILYSGNEGGNFFMQGNNFNDLQRVCSPKPLDSIDSPVASTFTNDEWIWAVHTEDGQNVYALIHDEFHDPALPPGTPCNGKKDPSNPCRYTGLTLAKSTDGGKTFTHPAGPIQNYYVTAPNLTWDPFSVPKNPGPGYDPPNYGPNAPTLIKRQEGGVDYYYAFFHSIQGPLPTNANTGICIMRTTDLSDPASWRAWDGDGFDLAMLNPYTAPNLNYPQCAFIGKTGLGVMSGGVTYNTLVQKYIMVGAMAIQDPDDNNIIKCGAWYSLSKDLIRWDRARLIKEVDLWGNNNCPAASWDGTEAYHVLIDHNELVQDDFPGFKKYNFYVTTATPHLYFMRYVNANNGVDRDLVRVPVTITCTDPAGTSAVC